MTTPRAPARPTQGPTIPPDPVLTGPNVERTACPICDATASTVLHARDTFAMGRCRGCRLVRQDPRRPVAAILSAYQEVASDPGLTVRRRREDDTLESWQTQPQAAYERGVAEVLRRRSRTGPPGTWIDVGAATGAVLVAARHAGFAVTGVELGRSQVEVCQRVHGLAVHHGTLAGAAYDDGTAEVISYRHVLEHVPDLVEELTEVRRVLADDGRLLIEVPNFAGLRYRWGRLRTKLRLCRPFWERVNVPEHLYYFTPSTLRRLLERRGFDVVWWTTYGRTRRRPSPVRRLYDGLRDRLKIGNKLRLIARKA